MIDVDAIGAGLPGRRAQRAGAEAVVAGDVEVGECAGTAERIQRSGQSERGEVEGNTLGAPRFYPSAESEVGTKDEARTDDERVPQRPVQPVVRRYGRIAP